MRIYIRQNGNHYKFYKDDDTEPFTQGYWKSSWKIKLHAKILTLDNKALATIEFKYAPWFWEKHTKTEYKITFHQTSESIIVFCLKSWSGHYSFTFNDQKYDFYFHQGHKKSLYKDKIQVAKYDKQTVSWWENDSAFIISNNDENELLLLSLFLLFDMGEYNEAAFNFDFGQAFKGDKEYDSRWIPTR